MLLATKESVLCFFTATRSESDYQTGNNSTYITAQFAVKPLNASRVWFNYGLCAFTKCTVPKALWWKHGFKTHAFWQEALCGFLTERSMGFLTHPCFSACYSKALQMLKMIRHVS